MTSRSNAPISLHRSNGLQEMVVCGRLGSQETSFWMELVQGSWNVVMWEAAFGIGPSSS